MQHGEISQSVVVAERISAQVPYTLIVALYQIENPLISGH